MCCSILVAGLVSFFSRHLVGHDMPCCQLLAPLFAPFPRASVSPDPTPTRSDYHRLWHFFATHSLASLGLIPSSLVPPSNSLVVNLTGPKFTHFFKSFLKPKTIFFFPQIFYTHVVCVCVCVCVGFWFFFETLEFQCPRVIVCECVSNIFVTIYLTVFGEWRR